MYPQNSLQMEQWVIILQTAVLRTAFSPADHFNCTVPLGTNKRNI